MKRILFAGCPASFFATAAAGLLMVFPASIRAAENSPEEAREKLASLQRKAEELKAEGRDEEARKITGEAAELRAQIDPKESDPRADRQKRVQELNRELDSLKTELKELSAEGRADEAARVKERFSRLERELDCLRARRNADRDDPPRPKPRRERPPRPERNRENLQPRVDGQGSPPDAPDMPNRLRHLRLAIENLHAAGLHEMAEHLTQEAEKMRGQLRDAPSPPHGPPGPRPLEGELAPLREQIQELRRAVEEMRRQLEQLRSRQP